MGIEGTAPPLPKGKPGRRGANESLPVCLPCQFRTPAHGQKADSRSSLKALSEVSCGRLPKVAGQGRNRTADTRIFMQAEAIPDPEHGSCFCVLAYAFNGVEFVALTDCSCSGEDCSRLTRRNDNGVERLA